MFTRALPDVFASFWRVASRVSSAEILLLTEGSTEVLRVGGGRGAVVVAVLKSEIDRVERRLAGEEAADADERLTTTLRGEVGGGMWEELDL